MGLQIHHSGESRPVDVQNCISSHRRCEGFLPTSLYYPTVNYLTYPGVKPHLHDMSLRIMKDISLGFHSIQFC